MSIKPPALKPGDTIGVMAPSSYVEEEDIEKSRAVIEERGYKVFIHPQTWEREHQSAGNVLQKSLALQGLWQRQDIKAIWAAGGGNRSLLLLDAIQFDKLKDKPRTFIGFSDATALLNGIYAHTGIGTVHGPVFKNVHKHKHMDQLFDVLEGRKSSMPLDQAKVLKDGKAEGPLVGGNLSVFQYLPQTLPGEFWKDAIIFLEDCNEELSRLDRMLLHLRRLGVFYDAAALIFGQFTNLQESGRPFGYTLEEVILEHTGDFDIPVIMNAPFGHGPDLYTLPVGGKALLDKNSAALHIAGSREN